MRLYETPEEIKEALSTEQVSYEDTIKLGAGALLSVLWNIAHQLALLNKNMSMMPSSQEEIERRRLADKAIDEIMAPPRLEITYLRRKPDETFIDYTLRWLKSYAPNKGK